MAAQAAKTQEAAAARAAAQSAVADNAAKPVETPDVSLNLSNAAPGAARKKRQSFGIGVSNTGVNI